ncbi:MAG: hypothetical protein ACWGNV_15635 [Bacteroidales bacterium]
MKKIIMTALVMGALLSGKYTNAYGSTTPPADNPTKSTVVSFTEVNAGDRLYIKDTYGNAFYSEKIENDGVYTKKFNLSELPEDKYYFEVDKGHEITVLPFNIDKENITLESGLKKNIAKPQLAVVRDQVFLERDVDGAQSVKVDIYYRGEELVHSEDVDRVGKLVRKYDFSNSRNGEYLFQIKYDDRTLSQYVTVL